MWYNKYVGKMDRFEFNQLLHQAMASRDREEVKGLAKVVAATANPYYVCDFCEYVDAADDPEIMPILQRAIEICGDPMHVYEFAFLMCDCDKKCVDYGRLQDMLISVQSPKILSYCAEYVPAFDRRALVSAIAECGDEKWTKHMYVTLGRELDDDARAALLQRLNAVRGLVIYPKSLERLQLPCKSYLEVLNCVCWRDDLYAMTEAAENLGVPMGVELRDMLGSMVRRYEEQGERSRGGILHIYEYGASVEGADIELVMRAAEKSGMAKYMYYVGAYVPNADGQRMLDAIKRTGNKKYIEMMEEHLRDSGEPGVA